MRFSIWVILSACVVLVTGCDQSDGTMVVVSDAAATTSTAPPTTVPVPATRPRPRNTEPEAPFWAELVEKGPVKPDRAVARVLQVLDSFDHPSCVETSTDGNVLYVANTAQSSAGAAMDKGSISRLTVDEEGRVQMHKADWVKGLHMPMGLAIMTKGTRKFPAGTLVVSDGATTGVDEQGHPVQDIKKFSPKLTFLDPTSGEILGQIPLVDGTPVAKSIFHPILAPAGVTFDGEGNLYLADTGNTGKTLDPEVSTRPGIIRIRYKNIDDFAENMSGADVSYIPVRHEPAAVYHCAIDDGLYWSTSDGRGPAGGAIYRIPRQMFPQQNMIENVIGDVGPLMGLCVTPRGTLLMSRVEGDLAFITQAKISFVPFNNQFSFNSPGDIRMIVFRNGKNVLYVPETDPASSESRKQRLWVILLPSGL